MKIIQITASYKPAYIYGGPIMSVAKLCEALQKHSLKTDGKQNNIDIEVFTTAANGNFELDVPIKQEVTIEEVSVTYFKRITKDHTHFSPSLLRHLILVLRKAKHKNQDLIIHIHAWWNMVSILSCWVAKWYGVPVIISPRGMLTAYTQNNRNSFSKSIIHFLIGKSLLKYAHIHATSAHEKEDVLKIVRPKSITIIPNLVDLHPLAKSKNPDNHAEFKLIFLSRIEEKKGLDLLLEALAELSLPWFLTIAGTGNTLYINRLKDKAKNLNLDNRINWIGQVSNENKFELLSQHDLLLLTSHNENFANVVIESLSVGTPVLVSEQVGLAAYVQNNSLGWVCRLIADDIKEKLQLAYLDLLKRQEIRKLALEIIRKDFNVDLLIAKYLELYEMSFKSTKNRL